METNKKYDALITVETICGRKITYDEFGSCEENIKEKELEGILKKEFECGNLSYYGEPETKIDHNKVVVSVSFR